MKTKNIDIWSKENPPAKNVDAFIKISPKQTQAKLKELRGIVHGMLPDAEEIISYRMPVFRYRGMPLVGLAGFKNHIGFYPMSGSFLEKFKRELVDYKTSKGAVQFPLNKPLPVGLIKKLILSRVSELKF